MAHQVTSNTPWILLIDDDVEFGKILELFLKKLDVRLERTTTVPDFAAIVKKDLPSACLIDLNLDGLVAGFALVTGLRKKYGDKLPIIVISATEDTAAISHAIECGADDYVVKPVDPQIFNLKVGRFVKLLKTPVEPMFQPAPAGGVAASIAFPILVKGMDELGLRTISPHFLCKGAPTTFRGELVAQIFPARESALASVLNCELLADGSYLVTYEFAELTTEDQNSLRLFLASAKPPEAKA